MAPRKNQKTPVRAHLRYSRSYYYTYIEMLELKGYNMNSRAKRARVQVLALPGTSCVTLGKLTNLSVLV